MDPIRFRRGMKALIVFSTAATRKEADKIAEALVKEKLAACVSIVPEIVSRYWWQGKIERSRELLLIIKTSKAKYSSVEKRIKKLHSYTVSEILAVSVLKGNPDYLKWMKENT
jgi:periplasmic divalent cation tolerance protein